MADFLEKRFHLDEGDIVEVTLAHRANALLLTEGNFYSYRNGSSFNYCGGEAKRSPYQIVVPHTGTWHLVLDLGGAAGRIEYSCRVIPGR